MELLDDKKIKMLHNLIKEKGITNVNVSMFSEEQRKIIYEGYGEQFLIYNGLWFMINAIVSYSLAKNIGMVEKKLNQELEYAIHAQDYDYALLCARLLQDKSMEEFIKNYNTTGKYDKVFDETIGFVMAAKPLEKA